MTSHLSFNSTSPEVYLWFFSNQIRGLDKPRVYYVSEKFRFQADWPCCLLELERMALSTRALQALLSSFLFAIVMEKWWCVLGVQGRGRLQSKLIVSIGLKRTLFSLLQRKSKLFLKYIKNLFSSIYFACMPPNYQANYKLFWCTHWSIFKIFRRRCILAFIALTWEGYKTVGYIRKTDDLKGEFLWPLPVGFLKLSYVWSGVLK